MAEREDSGRGSSGLWERRREVELALYGERPAIRVRPDNIIDYGYLHSEAGGEEIEPAGSYSGVESVSSARVPAKGREREHRHPESTDVADQDVLLVGSVDFQVSSNVRNHHTDDFDITEGADPQLVIRRGQVFQVQINFNRAYNTNNDKFRLLFEIGPTPIASQGTQVYIEPGKPGQWGATIAGQHGKSLNVSVTSPPDCIVGKWRFKVDVVTWKDGRPHVYRYNHKNPVYMLFNPWIKEDAVYLEKAEELEAYVLKQTGRMYVGSYNSWSTRPWAFGQFTGKVLDCSMYLLDRSRMSWSVRGDPVNVARKLSAMVNFEDDAGVLVGKWQEPYSDGTAPWKWTGSAPILEQYYRDRRPVRYGQCWVFSGVLTTVCRALGLPTRSVTNFESAYDEGASATVDYYYDHTGKYLGSPDSTWNFHVWNEAWMSRPDLPEGYGGWQAFDSTPQEASDGIFCCGPCPVRSLKEGEVYLPHDGLFVFAEVNADMVHWMKQEDGSWRITRIVPHWIGKLVSTLAIDGSRQDLTHQYKYPEGSAEERVVFLKVYRKANEKPDRVPQDVDFQLSFDAEHSFVGKDFQMLLHMTNRSRDGRTVTGVLSMSTMYYTGVLADELASQHIKDVGLKPGETRSFTVKIDPSMYLSKLKDGNMISLHAMVRVKETEQIFTKKDTARLRKPDLTIKALAAAKKDEAIDVEVSFTNPLDKTLTDCSLVVEGPGVTTTALVYPQGDVPAKETFVTTFKLTPLKTGKREIVVIFNARELNDVHGSHAMTIHE